MNFKQVKFRKAFAKRNFTRIQDPCSDQRADSGFKPELRFRRKLDELGLHRLRWDDPHLGDGDVESQVLAGGAGIVLGRKCL